MPRSLIKLKSKYKVELTISVGKGCNMKRTFLAIITTICLLLATGALITILHIDRPLFINQIITFTDKNGDTLVGTYYPGELPAGILLLEGFGSDQITMRNIARQFIDHDIHVFTFDFSGHGRSPGTLGYDNASTDRLAWQVLAAKKQFMQASGLDSLQIILLGHSLGARVALQSAILDSERIAGLILIGTQVNLQTNVQAEFFTGTNDLDLDWVQKLGPENPPTNILMLSGSWDDILTPQAADLLLDKLAGKDLEFDNFSDWGFNTGTFRSTKLYPRLLHNYEIFSAPLLGYATYMAYQFWGLPLIPPAPPWTSQARIVLWGTSLIGIFLVLIGSINLTRHLSANKDMVFSITITNLNRFLWAKLLLWLGALPIGILITAFFFFLPVGTPAFNLYYLAFLSGYGTLLFLLYRFGRMPGTQGSLPFHRNSTQPPLQKLLVAVGVSAALLFLTATFARTGWFFVFPLNVRFLWLILFTPITALGFWIGLHETQMITSHTSGKFALQLVSYLIGLFPFFGYTIFLLAIGSISGVVSGIQGLIILILVLLSGILIQQIGKRAWYTAIFQAVLLYWLILPQGVLFK
jgi:pimeloyl-ACP methyl ester carboxylesterase